jgi:hypothetical protein
MARTARKQQVVSASKAVTAASQQQANPGFQYDPNFNKLLFEGDPVDVGHNGVISVQVYSYNGNQPRIGVYRVGISKKTGQPWQVKEMCPLDAKQAVDLSKALLEAAGFLAKLKVS